MRVRTTPFNTETGNHAPPAVCDCRSGPLQERHWLLATCLFQHLPHFIGGAVANPYCPSRAGRFPTRNRGLVLTAEGRSGYVVSEFWQRRHSWTSLVTLAVNAAWSRRRKPKALHPQKHAHSLRTYSLCCFSRLRRLRIEPSLDTGTSVAFGHGLYDYYPAVWVR